MILYLILYQRQLIQNNNNSNNKYIIKIKEYTRECINEVNEVNEKKKRAKFEKYVKTEILPKLNDICNNIITIENKVEQSKYINEFFNSLLLKNCLTTENYSLQYLSNLSDILKYSTEETLELIVRVLNLPEVKKYLPIVRNKFLILIAQTCTGAHNIMHKRIEKIIQGEEINFSLNNSNKEQDKNYIMQSLTGEFYDYDLLNIINAHKNNIINNNKNNKYVEMIMNSLMHDNLENYVDDIIFEYKINKIHKLFNDNFKEFKSVLGNGNETINSNNKIKHNKYKKLYQKYKKVPNYIMNSELNDIRQLLTINHVRDYIIYQYNSKDEITKCITELDEIKNSNIIDDNNRDIFEMVYQAFKERKDNL